MNVNTGMEFKEHSARTKIISSRDLTSECWSIQFWGLPYCRKCDYLATEKCGGYLIRRKIFSGKYPRSGLSDLSDGF